MKKEYVKKQHYIPQFVLRTFVNSSKGIPFVNIKKQPLELMYSKPINLMQERDFYEIKNIYGEYVSRNLIEEIHSYIESDISIDYQKFIDLTLKEDFEDKFSELVGTEDWAKIEASLLLYLIQTLIRGRGIKNITYTNSELPKRYQDIIYLLMTTSKSITAKFAMEMFIGEELEGILHFIKDDTYNEAFPILAEHILNKYQIRVCVVEGNKSFFLSDNPVIVQKFEEEDYILPFSPKVCLILKEMKIEKNIIKIDKNIFKLDDDSVDRINKHSIQNTDRQLIVSKQSDLKFIEKYV